MSKTYDPKSVSLIIGGHIVSGYDDGTFVEVARNNDTFALVSGADGETTRAKSNDKSGTISITLLQTSLSNDVLSGFAQADELSNGGTFTVLLKDNNGNTLCSSAIAWVQKVADSAFGKEQNSRTWIIETGELQMFIGGTNPPA